MHRLFHCIAIALISLACRNEVSGRVRLSDYFGAGPQRRLAEAGEQGNVKEIDRLISRGADVNAVGQERMTALVWTLLHQNKKGFEHLLQKGANPNIPMEESKLTSDGLTDGSSAVSLSARIVDLWYLETVLKYGGDPNILNPIRKNTPIFECITLSDRRRPQEAQARIAQIRMLIAAGANLQALDRYGNTPMIAAAWAIRYDIIHVLLEAGADPEAKSQSGKTLLNEIGHARIDKKSDLFEWRTKVITILQRRGLDLTDDMPRLEGRWQVVSQKEGGIEVSDRPAYYEFSYLQLKVLWPDRRPEEIWGIGLDLWARPKEMTAIGQQRQRLLAYDLNGDMLRLSEIQRGRRADPTDPMHRPSIEVVLRRIDTK